MRIIIPRENPRDFFPINGLREYIMNLRSHNDPTFDEIAHELEDLFKEYTINSDVFIGAVLDALEEK